MSNASVDLDAKVKPHFFTEFGEMGDLVEGKREKLLAAEAGIDAHDEDMVHHWKDFHEGVDWSGGIDDYGRLHSVAGDLLEGPVQVAADLLMDGHHVGAGFGEVDDEVVGVFDHHVAIERKPGDGAEGLDHGRAEGDVGDEVAVHDVDVDDGAAAALGCGDFVGQVGEVGGQDGECQFNHLGIAPACKSISGRRVGREYSFGLNAGLAVSSVSSYGMLNGVFLHIIPAVVHRKETMYNAKAFSAAGATSPLASTTIARRDPTENDVQIEILFCGICHSDLHQARNEWSGVMPTVYPCVPGHEIVGRVTKVGSAVTKFKVGDLAAVGCMVDSDGTCHECKQGLEQFCPNFTLTYNFPDKHTGGVTYGGYSDSIVVTEKFVLKVPSNLDLAGAAPLLCAGITTYSPMHHWGVTKGKKVGVVGLGGLGHMGVKFAHALGAHVVLFTTSPNKKDDALRLGADEVVISRNADEMAKHAGSFDFILDAVSADHDINAYLNLLRRDGNLTLVGAPEKPLPVSAFALLFGRRSLSGSPIGGIAETQEMLDFCGKHNITADVEVIPIQKVNEAYERLQKADVKYRFSIDMASLKG